MWGLRLNVGTSTQPRHSAGTCYLGSMTFLTCVTFVSGVTCDVAKCNVTCWWGKAGVSTQWRVMFEFITDSRKSRIGPEREKEREREMLNFWQINWVFLTPNSNSWRTICVQKMLKYPKALFKSKRQYLEGECLSHCVIMTELMAQVDHIDHIATGRCKEFLGRTCTSYSVLKTARIVVGGTSTSLPFSEDCTGSLSSLRSPRTLVQKVLATEQPAYLLADLLNMQPQARINVP